MMALLGGSLFLTSCEDDDDPSPDNGNGGDSTITTVEKSGEITANETWTSDKIYELNGKVVVTENVTLEIEPGTIIKGQEGSEASASALVVARGGKIMAEGTADNPIIFTSVLDNIAIGEKAGTNLDETDNEKWGGLIILGRAPISAENGDTEAAIEGLPADAGYGLYGGDNEEDNSGVLKYVSIRHGGILIGDGNEINGLTLGGVGSGTVIENVEVYATLDDGIEFFGGSVDVKNALVYWQGDDGVDIDQNYSGTVNNFAVIHGDGVGTDEGLEIDGPEGSTYTDGLFTLINGTIMGSSAEGSAADIKSKAQGTIENVYFSGYADDAYIKLRTSYEDFCGDIKGDSYNNYIADSPTLVIKNSAFANASAEDVLVEVYTASKVSDADDAPTCEIKDGQQDAVDAVLADDTYGNTREVGSATVGADLSVFDNWTITSIKGGLN